MTAEAEDSTTLARKRRIEQRRAAARAGEIGEAEPATKKARPTATSEDETDAETPQLPSIRGIKKQSRYVPGVEMSKEELRKWRAQARRVRNRESAAASRAKTRERITELEGEVSSLQEELAKAKARIAELEEKEKQVPQETKSLELRQVVMTPHSVSPVSSPGNSPRATPRTLSAAPVSFSLDSSSSCEAPLSLPPMISRPTAAKIHTTGETVSDVSSEESGEEDATSEDKEPGSSSSGEVAPEDDDAELGNFLWDAFTDYDPNVTLADLCA